MPKIFIMGESPVTRLALCWVGVDDAEYKIPYDGGKPSYIDLSPGAHAVYVTTESRLSRNMATNDGSIGSGLASFATGSTNDSVAYNVNMDEGDVLFVYVQMTMKPRIHVKMTTEDELDATIGELKAALEAEAEASAKRFAGFLWFLLSLVPVAGIGVGIFQFCRLNKRIVLGVFCIVGCILSSLIVTGVIYNRMNASAETRTNTEKSAYTEEATTATETTTNRTEHTTVRGTTRIPEDMDGAITKAPMETSKPAQTTQPGSESYRIKYVSVDVGLYLRKGPGTEYDSIVLMNCETPVKVYRTEKEWSYVEYAGQYGWCASQYLITKTTQTTAAEEKTEFDVVLTDVGAKKLNVIKAVREITGLGLKEAKDLVESAPKAIKEGVSKDEAENLKNALVEAGATVELK